jgi:hypothetical protein
LNLSLGKTERKRQREKSRGKIKIFQKKGKKEKTNKIKKDLQRKKQTKEE